MSENTFVSVPLWEANDEYSNHRIPGMIVTHKGTLLVYCEARRSLSDWAQMDILLKRSKDGGKSFFAPVILAHGTEEHPTVNNPVMMQDINGRIHFIYCEDYAVNGGRVLHRYSDDDGISFSKPKDISNATLPDFRNVFALGPGHGICTQNGTLLVPVWMVPKVYNSPIKSHKPSVVSVLYSLDNGEHWKCGDILETTPLAISPNESVAASLEDGSVYMNIRCSLTSYRVRAYSKNGYSDFYGYEPDTSLIDPVCFGSTVSFSPENKPFTLLFANCESKTQRKNVTLKASFDFGKTWPFKRVIDPERGGYVELACDKRGDNIYLAYEENYGEKCFLVSFSHEDINKIG